MEKQTNGHKMPGPVKALLILLIVLFVLAGIPFLYLSFGGYPYEDAETALAAPPMASADRYRFHADERTVDIFVTPGDLWWITRHTDFSEDWDAVTDALAAYDLAIKGCGLSFTEDGAVLDASLLYKGFLPLPVRVEAALALNGGDMEITVTGASIGRLIHIDPSALPIGADMSVLTVELPEVHSRLRQIQSVRTENGGLLLSCGLGRELVGEMLENPGQAEEDALYMADNYPLMLSRGFAEGDGGEIFRELLTIWERDPAEFVSFKQQELTFAEDFKASLYFSCQDGRFLPRFLPELTAEGIQAASDDWYGERTRRFTGLRDAVANLATLNSKRRLTLSEGRYLNQDAGNVPVTLAQVAGSLGEPDWMDRDGVRVILGANANYYMTEALDPIGRMPVESKAALKGLRTNEKYVPLLLLKTANGHPAVAFIQKGGTLTLREIDADQYDAAMAETGMPVYDLQIQDAY